MTATDLLLITLSAAALHRIWNYEEVCATARAWADKVPYLRKPVLCPACNAFWFGLVAAVLWMFAHPFVLIGLSAYAATRVMVWVWPFVDDWAKKTPAKRFPETKPTGKLITPIPQQVPTKPFDRIVVLLTALNDFTDSYSVSIDVLHQARAIAMQNPTWQVQVWMSEGAKQTGWNFMPENTFVRTIVPRMAWQKDMPVDEASVDKLLTFMKAEMGKLPKDTVVIEHDLMFVSWYAPFAEAMHRFNSGLLWFHVPHSMPGSREGKHQALVTLPAGSHFISPVAKIGTKRFADYYNTTEDRVIPVPNLFDPRTWGSWSNEIFDIVAKTKLLSFDYVQILPACSTRLEAKGFTNIAKVFSILNKSHKAHLLVCNPNASPKLVQDARARAGLPAECLSFTSEILPSHASRGINGADVKTLMQDYGNIFVFPSISEADSKVCLEARLCRQYIVANADVPTLEEHADILVPFGTSAALNPSACEYAANRILDLGDKIRIRRHAGRDLEGIGDLWRQVINDARLP